MQADAHAHAPRQLPRIQWMLVVGLALVACGRTEDGTSPVVSSASPPAARQSPVPELRWLDAQAISPNGAASPPPAIAAGAAEPTLDPVRLAQLSALPHLSALSAREKAGLLLLLPPMSPSERLELIEMYPSLVKLPVQQREILLDKLEKIVPLPASAPVPAAQPR